MIKGVLFDKDGTLFSFTETWGTWCQWLVAELCPDDVYQQHRLASELGYNIEQHTFAPGAAFISESADQTAQMLAGLLPDKSVEQVEAAGLKVLDNLPLAPVTDLPALFAQLRNLDLTIGLATNDYESTARDHLVQLNISEYFDFICGFDSGFGSKPEPGMIHAFCQHTSLAPQNVAMVGDSTHDLKAGRAAGVALAVGVLSGPAVHDELVADAHAVVPDISYLPELLERKPD